MTEPELGTLEEARTIAAVLRAALPDAVDADQIRCMWHGRRERDQISPPVIPLKIFVWGTGQDQHGTWASIEVHPGMDDWDAL